MRPIKALSTCTRFLIALGLLLSLSATALEAATLAVTNTTDNSAGSLRQAVQAANAGDTVAFQIPLGDGGYNSATSTFTITLTSGEIQIAKDLNITGPAATKIAISGNNISRVFNVISGNVAISNLTAENGRVYGASGSPAGGAGGNGDGGGILNYGRLALTSCTLVGNEAIGGTAVASMFDAFKGGAGRGGGIFNSGTLVVVNCTFTSNTAMGGNGSNAGPSGNRDGGDSYGGAIANQGTLSLASSTLAGNNAASGNPGTANGGSFGDAYGGALFQGGAGTTSTGNSIIAVNQSDGYVVYQNPPGCGCLVRLDAGQDIIGAIVSSGYNLIGRTDGNSGWASSDLLGGTSAGTALDPQLGLFQDNGGPTLTMKPAPGSRVIDRGNRGTDSTGQPLNLDQRGDLRPVDQAAVTNANGGDGSDIGAVEVGVPQSGTTLTVTTTVAGASSDSCATDYCTLQGALNATNTASGIDTINFRPGLTGTTTTQATFFGLSVLRSVIIQGPGARLLTLTGAGVSRVFNNSGADVRISGLTMANGHNPGSASPSRLGGAIYNVGGLTLTDCAINTNNAAYNGDGAGVYNSSGASLTLVRCTFYGNYAEEFGGGLYNDGALSATNCTFSANSAFRGGAIISRFNNGASSSVLRNCTITGGLAFNNDGGQGGGGYYAEGGAQQHHLGNTIVAGNSSFTINDDLRGNFTSDGHNFIGDAGASAGFTNSINGDQVGSTASPKNPNLAATLQNNGGPTDTRALQAGSTAINAGDDSIAPATDQRDYLRAGVSDIGSYEFNGTLPILKITSITRLANGHISLQGLGVPSSVHTIEAGSDPSGLTFLGTASSNVSGALQYDDAGAVGLTRRFYRLTFP